MLAFNYNKKGIRNTFLTCVLLLLAPLLLVSFNLPNEISCLIQ